MNNSYKFNSVMKFIICLVAGYVLILMMSLTTPKVLWLKMGLLLILTYASVQSFYFWAAPDDLKSFNLRFIPVFAILSGILSYIRHGLIVHDFRVIHVTPVLFALILPLLAGRIFRNYRER